MTAAVAAPLVVYPALIATAALLTGAAALSGAWPALLGVAAGAAALFRATLRSSIPFGPSMLAGAFLAIVVAALVVPR